MLTTKSSEGFGLDKKADIEQLDPLIEVSESVNDEGSVKRHSEAVLEIPPRIFGVFDVKDDLTKESLKNAIYELGVIELCWPEIQDPVFESRTCFPRSYYTNSEKERLILAYAENFRRQFIFKRTTHKALLLQAPNECGLQKMVCTTLRPTKLCHQGMDTWRGCASLVGDYFDYEPLLKPMLLPERIMSPLTCVERRSGNSFELATVLVSYLIGAEYDAYVVLGYATRDTTVAFRGRTVCPYLPRDDEDSDEEKPPAEDGEAVEPRYKLAALPDLTSRFLREMDAKAQKKRQDELDKIEEERRKELEELEAPPPDDMDGWRTHGWVLVQPSRDVSEPFFIEPSEGEAYALDEWRYQAVHAVYNHENYYVNMQDCRDLSNIQYDLMNLEHWEHMLAGEPTQSRVMPGVDMADPSSAVDTEKHMDMPASWVEKLAISLDEYEKRYPGGHKIVCYKKVSLEKFAPYSRRDGMVKLIKVHEDYELMVPLIEYKWYSNREDHMLTEKMDHVRGEVKETFSTGREDFLKAHTYEARGAPGSIEVRRKLKFFYYARLDHLTLVETAPLSYYETFTNREDRLESRKVEYTEGEKKNEPRELHTIMEAYGRNPSVPAVEDVQTRTFLIQDGNIELVFHYAYNFVTMSTRAFIKPNLAESGGKILFDPEKTSGYIADPNEKPPRPLPVYYLLCGNMELEARSRKHIRDYEADIASYLRTRHRELTDPQLIVYLFHTERNEKAKRLWKEQETQKREMSDREIEADLDPLTPYLVRMFGAKWRSERISHNAATILREQCLNDFKARQLARQTLVHDRFEAINNEHKNKRLWYLANQFILSPQKEAAYFETSGLLAFQVHTLEVRLVRYAELSAARAQVLECTLDAHPLLRQQTRHH